MTWIVLATEDELTEQVGVCLAEEAGLQVERSLKKYGFGYLQKRIRSFCEITRRLPVFLITDLDRSPCPSALISYWMREEPSRPTNLIFRVAVREVES